MREFGDEDLIKRYHLSRAGILYVTDLVRDTLESDTKRNQALTPEMKVIITLRYLATGKMQQCNGDDMGVSQSPVSRVIGQTLDALSSRDMRLRFIHFPTAPQAVERKKAEFMNIAQFPGVVGVIEHSSPPLDNLLG